MKRDRLFGRLPALHNFCLCKFLCVRLLRLLPLCIPFLLQSFHFFSFFSYKNSIRFDIFRINSVQCGFHLIGVDVWGHSIHSMIVAFFILIGKCEQNLIKTRPLSRLMPFSIHFHDVNLLIDLFIDIKTMRKTNP